MDPRYSVLIGDTTNGECDKIRDSEGEGGGGDGVSKMVIAAVVVPVVVGMAALSGAAIVLFPRYFILFYLF